MLHSFVPRPPPTSSLHRQSPYKMPSLLPLLSLAAFAISSASADTLLWSKVDTSKPSSTSPLVWSKANTAKPTSTSPIVWSKVETSKSSSSSPSPTSSPLVWSKVITSKPTTTSTPVWSRVITTRTPASTNLVASTTSSPSATPCQLDYRILSHPTCRGSPGLQWFNTTGYQNYKTYFPHELDVAQENSSKFHSGQPCPNITIPTEGLPLMLISVSDEFAETYGGFDAVCGKEIILANRDPRFTRAYSWATRALIVHSCSQKFCPSGLGVGNLYTAKQPYMNVLGWSLPPFVMITPSKPHLAMDYSASWV
ncbi:hypothetical protein JCM5353_005873 [Sporobolomyces roseus]